MKFTEDGVEGSRGKPGRTSTTRARSGLGRRSSATLVSCSCSSPFSGYIVGGRITGTPLTADSVETALSR
jgi:hypothetical protein